jgi:transposase
MTAALSLDLRKKVLDLIASGERITKVAKLFKLSRTTIYSWMARSEQGNLEADKRSKGVPYKIDPVLAQKILMDNRAFLIAEDFERLSRLQDAVWFIFRRIRPTIFPIGKILGIYEKNSEFKSIKFLKILR